MIQSFSEPEQVEEAVKELEKSIQRGKTPDSTADLKSDEDEDYDDSEAPSDAEDIESTESKSDIEVIASDVRGKGQVPRRIAPKNTKAPRRAPKAAEVGTRADSSILAPEGEFCGLCYKRYLTSCVAAVFAIEWEVDDPKATFKNTNEVKSDTTLVQLRDVVAEKMGIHPTQLLLGWKLSSAKKTDLPSRIADWAELQKFYKVMRPLCVLELTRAGKLKPLKGVWVKFSNLNEVASRNEPGGRGGKTKVSWISFPAAHISLTLVKRVLRG